MYSSSRQKSYTLCIHAPLVVLFSSWYISAQKTSYLYSREYFLQKITFLLTSQCVVVIILKILNTLYIFYYDTRMTYPVVVYINLQNIKPYNFVFYLGDLFDISSNEVKKRYSHLSFYSYLWHCFVLISPSETYRVTHSHK